MSRRAIRVSGDASIEPFAYVGVDQGASVVVSPARPRTVQLFAPGGPQGQAGVPFSAASPGQPAGTPPAPAAPLPGDGDRERDAFAQGYAQGERAGIDVAARQLQTVHARLGQTLDQLVGLREELTYRTERQVVELALAMATRILHREISLDRELLLVMARIALDRMGDGTTATIRLHPDDEAAARGGREAWPDGAVAIVADPSIRPGGCLVQTDKGQIEVGVDAQVKELATALLGDLPIAPAVAAR